MLEQAVELAQLAVRVRLRADDRARLRDGAHALARRDGPRAEGDEGAEAEPEQRRAGLALGRLGHRELDRAGDVVPQAEHADGAVDADALEEAVVGVAARVVQACFVAAGARGEPVARCVPVEARLVGLGGAQRGLGGVELGAERADDIVHEALRRRGS